MGKKYIVILMQVLTSICLISVGFASWTIVSGVSIEESGTISAEGVDSNERYITLISCDNFRYYDTGFVNTLLDDNNKEYQGITTSTYMTYNYELNLSNLIVDMKGNTDINIRFTFSHSSVIKDVNTKEEYTIIKDYFDGYVIETTCKYEIIEQSINTSNNNYILNISFKDLINQYEGNETEEINSVIFKIKMKFNLEKCNEYNEFIDSEGLSEIYFKNNVYDCFIDSNFGFLMKVDVEYVEQVHHEKE